MGSIILSWTSTRTGVKDKFSFSVWMVYTPEERAVAIWNWPVRLVRRARAGIPVLESMISTMAFSIVLPSGVMTIPTRILGDVGVWMSLVALATDSVFRGEGFGITGTMEGGLAGWGFSIVSVSWEESEEEKIVSEGVIVFSVGGFSTTGIDVTVAVDVSVGDEAVNSGVGMATGAEETVGVGISGTGIKIAEGSGAVFGAASIVGSGVGGAAAIGVVGGNGTGEGFLVS